VKGQLSCSLSLHGFRLFTQLQIGKWLEGAKGVANFWIGGRKEWGGGGVLHQAGQIRPSSILARGESRRVVSASGEKFVSGAPSIFHPCVIIIPVEPSSKETLTWQIQIHFPHIFHVSFFTCVMAHVSCDPIIFSLLLCFLGGVGRKVQCEVLFFPTQKLGVWSRWGMRKVT